MIETGQPPPLLDPKPLARLTAFRASEPVERKVESLSCRLEVNSKFVLRLE